MNGPRDDDDGDELPILDELATYVGFGAEDAALLPEVRPLVEPAFPAAVDEFYAQIEATPGALAVMKEGPRQVRRLKGTLLDWLGSIFVGPWDAAYVERRARIGRVHVRIGLEQRYMFGAMNLLRAHLHNALDDALPHPDWPAERTRHAHRAVDRVCDLELAIMLETYREGYVRQIRGSERLATLGQLAATIGHELRNPLAVIDTSVHLLRRRTDEVPGAERHLRRIAEQTAISNRIIADLLELARDRDPAREHTDLLELIDRALETLPLPAGITMDRAIDPNLPKAWVDGSQLRQVVINLVANAYQSAAGTGGSTVRLEAEPGTDGALVLRILDDGAGLTPEVEARLFEPLFTTRSRGVGLGLALCRRIVEKHRGTIRGANRPDQRGALFEVVLPGALSPPAAATPRPEE